MVKNLPAVAGGARDGGSIPESGRSPGVRNGNPFQCSRLENSMGRGAWQVTVQGDHKESDMSGPLSTHTHTPPTQALCWGNPCMEFSQDSYVMNAYQSFFTDEEA